MHSYSTGDRWSQDRVGLVLWVPSQVSYVGEIGAFPLQFQSLKDLEYGFKVVRVTEGEPGLSLRSGETRRKVLDRCGSAPPLPVLQDEG